MMTAATYGAYSAVVGILITLTGYFTGMDHSSTGKYFGWIGFVVLGVMIYLAIKARREEEGGYMSYGKCVGTGTIVGLVSSFIMAIFMFVYVSYINPEIIDYIVGETEKALLQQHMPADKVAQALRMTRTFAGAPIQAIFTLLGGTLVAVIISLIMGIFTRSKGEEPLIQA